MKTLILLSTLVFLVTLALPLHAQGELFVIWVFDRGSADSQFGYYDGSAAIDVGGVFPDYDIEGLACLQRTIYGVSGHDGRRASELFTIGINVATNQTTLRKVGDIVSSDQQPYYEVASLAEKSDGTLWAYADRGDQRGIIRIDPTTAVAEMIKPARYKVEGVEWLGDTLWLVGNTQFYTWQPGGEITKAFQVASNDEIEALDVINGQLWVNIPQNNLTIIPVNPTTGQVMPGGFKGHDDLESLTYCVLAPLVTPTPTPSATPQPTATDTPAPTETSTPSPTASATVLPTATSTPSPVSSATATQTVTPVVSPPATPTNMPRSSDTPTPKASPTVTTTLTPTTTPSPLATLTATATSTATPIRTITATITPAARTTPFATPEVTPFIPTNEDDDDEPHSDTKIFLPISHR